MNRSLFLENNISQFIIRYSQQARALQQSKQKPISVSSQHTLLKLAKKKRLDCTEIVPLEKSKHRSSAVHSLHTNTDERKEEKQYSRVPIQYFEERDGGNPADRVRGRVVYRGYAPKNTYYYFKTIKQLRFSLSKVERDFHGEDIIFNSKFESGNLNAAVRINARQYWLYMREDTNTHGLRQWFFFEVRTRKAGRFRFRIYRYTKKFSLYKMGMKPFVRTGQCDWHQQGEKVVYEYDSEQKCFYLQFEYCFEEHKEYYFASLPPYTYTMMAQYLETLAVDERVSVRKIGFSLGGLDLYSVSICGQRRRQDQNQQYSLRESTLRSSSLRQPSLRQSALRQSTLRQSTVRQSKHQTHCIKKQAIVVLARTHPGETVSNWALQSFIAKLLEIPILTEHYNFYILPMVNPDGVFLGNHRTGLLGQDINRKFHSCDLDFFPQIEVIQSFISSLLKKQKIAFLFDLHGHSAKKNIFAFGEQCEIGSIRYLYGRIIPKILANSTGSFKYDHCVFKASREKTNTARVFFSKRYGLNAVTFQQSYGLLDSGAIGILHWRNFGKALADSLAVFLGLGKDNIELKIENYLKQQICSENQEIEKKKLRKEEKRRQLQKQREKEFQKEKEESKAKLSPSKTQGCEDSPPKFVTDIIRKMKQKSPSKVQNIEQQLCVKTSISSKQGSDHQDDQSSLSSGDEQLELRPSEFQLLKKEIIRVGIGNRELQRELYSMAEKKMELGHHYVDFSNRLHHKQSSVVQRIFKFKNRQRIRDGDGMQVVSHREKGSSIELPAIKR